jgi:hypothetical protein
MDCYTGGYLHRPLTAPSSSNRSSLKKEDSAKNGNATGHQHAKNYSTGLCKSLNSASMNTKIPTSKRSYTVLPPRPPPITPCGKLQKKLKPVTQTSSPIRTLQGAWARSNAEKAQAFANHLATIFQPPPSDPTSTSLLETPFQLEPPVNRLKRSEVHAIIHNLPPKKSPGYDLMTGKILKELSPFCIQYLTQLFNAILLHGYFPAQWKLAQIILILKPGKLPHHLSSYRPSLLPLASKVFEKLLLKRLLPLVEHANLILNHLPPEALHN